MKMHDPVPLTEDMFPPYLPTQTKEVVVRIYKKEKWFIGFLSSIAITSAQECKLRVEPMAEYNPSQTDPTDIDLDHTLVTTQNPVIQFSDRWQPFTLINPHKVLCEKECDQTLVIQFSDGLAILSTRDDDIRDTSEFIILARTQHP